MPEANGRFTVYTNTQALYFSLDNTSIILQVPGNRLHFVGGTVGGGFGGKVDVIVEPIATLAAMKTGRPVRYVYSRSEEMQVSSTRSAWRIYHQGRRHGRRPIVARKVTSYADCGAYSRQTPYAITKHAANAAGPYAHPERLDRRLLRVHEPPADERDARLRRHDGLVRARGPDGQDRRARRARPVDGPLPATPTATAT